MASKIQAQSQDLKRLIKRPKSTSVCTCSTDTFLKAKTCIKISRLLCALTTSRVPRHLKQNHFKLSLNIYFVWWISMWLELVLSVDIAIELMWKGKDTQSKLTSTTI